MLRRALRVVAVGVMLFLGAQGTVRAGMTPIDPVAANNGVEARQYQLPDRRVAGNESLRQNITAWKVTTGSWNGEYLGGLSLVLVETASDNGSLNPTTNCYVSQLATTAQREALVSAFLAAQGLSPGDVTSWRIEPSMIQIEVDGQTVIIHLGLIS